MDSGNLNDFYLSNIRFLTNMNTTKSAIIPIMMLGHVSRHWNDMYEDEEDDDAGESTGDRS